MGLAASQARFLAITARKADCESKSMEYAQEKLDISRKMATATANYQNSLNATKLVWDASAAETAITDLSYDVMMTPNPLNGYDPYLLTDTTGRVILSSKYAAAIEAAGIPKEGCNGSDAGYKKFIEAIVDKGILAEAMGELAIKNGYVPGAGRGAEPLDKTTTNAMTLGTMQDYMDNSNFAINMSDLFLYDTGNIDAEGKPIIYELPYSNERKNSDETYTLTKNGTILSTAPTDGSITIGDLLSDKYIFTSNGTSEENFDKIMRGIILKLAETLGYNSATPKGLFTDAQSQAALSDAYQETLLRFDVIKNKKDAGKSNSTGAYSNTLEIANDYNTVAYSKYDSGKKTKYAASFSNILNTFLTAFAQSLLGYESGYSIQERVKDSVLVTEDPSYYYVVHNDNTIATETDLLIADFYNIMYNNICSNGWTTLSGANIEDKEYLSHALKNGQIFISSLNTDGYYYQGAYTENGYVQEVTDDDAIAEAEAEYNKIKTTLNYKEQKIDLKVKNLDLEISALSTEYDTVKQLISKGVEKTFSMFNS